MSDAAAKSAYLVDADSDPVVVRIEGRASFQNSACLRDFVAAMLGQGKSRFVVDFQHCASMDSTFLGVLAGAAIELRKTVSGGSFVLTLVGRRNLELICNLGLHRLMTVDAGDFSGDFGKCDTALSYPQRTEIENARLVLEAHENLVTADDANRSRFQDVLAFLRNRVEPK